MSKRQGVMLATKFSAKRLSKWPTPYLVQPKINGMRCRVEYRSTGGLYLLTMLSSQGNDIVCLPHLTEQLGSLYRQYDVPVDTVFDGELYIPGMPIQDIISLCKRGTPIEGYEQVEYHIFDIINSRPQADRLQMVLDYIQGKLYSPQIKLVSTNHCYAPSQLGKAMSVAVCRFGHEGIIIRKYDALYKDGKSTDLMKLKPTKTDEYIIMASIEEISIQGEPKGTLGAFVCITMSGQRFKVGSGPALTKQGRQDFWDYRTDLPNSTAVIKYQELSKRGVPLFPVLMEVKFKK